MIRVLRSYAVQSNYLGLISYADGLQRQAAVREGSVVFGLEHRAVITLGVRGDVQADVFAPQSRLLELGVEVVQTTRGGQATVHSEGQLVIYPCLDLRVLELGARDYVCLIQRTTRQWLNALGIKAEECGSEPGLYVGNKKLVAFGFKISGGRASHGLAINVANDLGLFALIRPCGVAAQPVTRLRDLGVDQALPELFAEWSEALTDCLAHR